MDYWESGMHLASGSDLFESFCNYQRRLIREFNTLAREFGFITVDARRSPNVIQKKLRDHIGSFLRNGSSTLKHHSGQRIALADIAPVTDGNGLAEEEATGSADIPDLDSIKAQAAK